MGAPMLELELGCKMRPAHLVELCLASYSMIPRTPVTTSVG